MKLLRLTAAALSALACSPGLAQERGQMQSYGTDGRLFSSSSTSDSFLLSRQSYASEDSSGFNGDVRIVKKYEGGGYEIILQRYFARCFAPFDHLVQILWADPEDENSYTTVNIVNAGRFPGEEKKDSYNLYWAACKEQFQKYK